MAFFESIREILLWPLVAIRTPPVEWFVSGRWQVPCNRMQPSLPVSLPSPLPNKKCKKWRDEDDTAPTCMVAKDQKEINNIGFLN
jgi:hypothetical protein